MFSDYEVVQFIKGSWVVNNLEKNYTVKLSEYIQNDNTRHIIGILLDNEEKESHAA